VRPAGRAREIFCSTCSSAWGESREFRKFWESVESGVKGSKGSPSNPSSSESLTSKSTLALESRSSVTRKFFHPPLDVEWSYGSGRVVGGPVCSNSVGHRDTIIGIAEENAFIVNALECTRSTRQTGRPWRLESIPSSGTQLMYPS
jgi:hypothetical protein